MRRAFAVGLAGLLLALGACEGDPNDPQTWIKKLDEGALREKAVEELTRIYTDTLNTKNGNADDPAVKAMRDVLVPPMVAAFKQYRDDVGAREKILDALASMRDPRAEEVFIAALDFTPDLSEAQAVKGAEGLGALRLQAGVEPLLACLAKITGNRPVDNQLKRAIVEAFMKIEDPRSVPAMIQILDTSAEEQDFFVNKLTAIALGVVGDPRAVPVLIRALFMEGRGASIFQQARYSLVQIGGPAVDPLIRAIKGQDPELQRMATARSFLPGVVQWKCARILGDIGDPRAIDALLELVASTDQEVQGWATAALGQLARTPEAMARVTAAITPKLREEATFGAWVSIIGALAIMGGPERMATIRATFEKEMLPDPGIRVSCAMWWSRLATSDESAAFERTVNEEDDQGLKDGLNVHRVRFVAAGRCTTDVACWIGKLDDADPIVADKAAFMLGQLAAGDAAAQTALIAHLNARNTELRQAVLNALDRLSSTGCPACVERIRAIAVEEEGRQSYALVNSEALCTAARMESRASSAAGGAR
jgi:HEAT repeat protein